MTTSPPLPLTPREPAVVTVDHGEVVTATSMGDLHGVRMTSAA
jgi:hypothetical protein